MRQARRRKRKKRKTHNGVPETKYRITVKSRSYERLFTLLFSIRTLPKNKQIVKKVTKIDIFRKEGEWIRRLGCTDVRCANEGASYPFGCPKERSCEVVGKLFGIGNILPMSIGAERVSFYAKNLTNMVGIC